MKKGDFRTREQCTGKVLLTPNGETGAHDMGDLEGHKYDLSREGADVLAQLTGHHMKIGNLTGVVGIMWEFTLREIFGPVQAMLLAGTQGADTTQAAVTAPSGTSSHSSVTQGKTYSLGKLNVNTVVVTVSAATKTEGTDYEIDKGSGMLYIIPGGTIATGANVSVTFGCAQVVQENFTSLDKSGMQRFAFEFHEKDQHDANGTPLRISTCTAQAWIEGGNSHDGKKPSTVTLKVVAITKPVVKRASV